MGCFRVTQKHQPLRQVLSGPRRIVGGEVTAGHTDSPPLHGLWLCSVSEALIKEGPQQVFENLFLPTVL